MGYGDSGTVPQTFYLRKEQNVDVGILKLFLSREQVDFSDVVQSSPFDSESNQVGSASLQDTARLRGTMASAKRRVAYSGLWG